VRKKKTETVEKALKGKEKERKKWNIVEERGL